MLPELLVMVKFRVEEGEGFLEFLYLNQTALPDLRYTTTQGKRGRRETKKSPGHGR